MKFLILQFLKKILIIYLSYQDSIKFEIKNTRLRIYINHSC